MSDYQVEIDSAGRSGNVSYKEPYGCLTFWWEFTSNGAVVNIPSPDKWDGYCAVGDAAWAQGRRQEIVVRIAEATKRQRASSATIEYEDVWIVLKF